MVVVSPPLLLAGMCLSFCNSTNPSHSFVAMRSLRREVRSKSAVNTSYFEGITVRMQCAIGVWNGGPSMKRHVGSGVMALAC